jgi:hypothetical protein
MDHSLGIWLNKLNRGIGTDVEALPVDHRALGGLNDVEVIARLADGCSPCS